MSRTSTRLFGLLLASTALIAVSGCESLRRFAPGLAFGGAKVSPAPADLPPPSPNAAEDRLYAGAAKAIQSRNYDLALEALQDAYAARPRDARVLNALAVVYDKLGRFDLSDRYYDLAEAVDPGSQVVAANRRYSMLLRQGVLTNQSDGANPSDGAVALAANADPTVTMAAGKASDRVSDNAPSHDSRGAIPRVARAVALVPTPAAAPPSRISEDELYARSVSLIERRKFGLALGNLNVAYAIRPNDPRVLSALGVVYDWLGRFDLSAHYYDLAEAADPGSPIIANNRRYSAMLQHHGGANIESGVVLARDGSSAPMMSLVKPPLLPARGLPTRPLPTRIAQRAHPHGAAIRRPGGGDAPRDADVAREANGQ